MNLHKILVYSFVGTRLETIIAGINSSIRDKLINSPPLIRNVVSCIRFNLSGIKIAITEERAV